MLNVVVFPDFEATAAATKTERQLLDAIRSIRKATGATFVNLSVFDHATETPGAIHYLTYPMGWISNYVRNNYPGFDPFQTTDFRRVSHIDWQDLYGEGVAADIFRSFTESGLGRNGISLTIHVGKEQYCVVSLVFRTGEELWERQKQVAMALYRREAHRLAEAFADLHESQQRRLMRLTPRELDVLRNAAMGKTDEQIGQQLGIGKWTVVSHLQSAKYKLGSTNRTSAVVKAISSGLIVLKMNGPSSESANNQSPNSR